MCPCVEPVESEECEEIHQPQGFVDVCALHCGVSMFVQCLRKVSVFTWKKLSGGDFAPH